MSARFATLILVGPGIQVSSRMQDVVTGLFHVEPGCVELVLIDDGMACSREQVQAWIPVGCKLTILKNPRNGVGDGWADGLTVGMIAGLKHLASRDDIEFVLKLDDDSVVFNRFSDRLSCVFREHPHCGMAGTFRKFPDGTERSKPGFMIERQISPYLLAKFLARSVLETWNPRLIFTAIRRRKLMLAARQNGLRDGEHVQGGGHACSHAFVRELSARGLLDDPFVFFPSRIGEDVALTILCYTLGFAARDYNAPGEVFAVVNTGIPDSPAALIRDGYAIAHSVKKDERWPEAEIRDAFAQHRRSIAPDNRQGESVARWSA